MPEHLDLTVKLITFRPAPSGAGVVGEAALLGSQCIRRAFIRPGAGSSPALAALAGKVGFALMGEIRDGSGPDAPLYTFFVSHMQAASDAQSDAGFGQN